MCRRGVMSNRPKRNSKDQGRTGLSEQQLLIWSMGQGNTPHQEVDESIRQTNFHMNRAAGIEYITGTGARKKATKARGTPTWTVTATFTLALDQQGTDCRV